MEAGPKMITSLKKVAIGSISLAGWYFVLMVGFNWLVSSGNAWQVMENSVKLERGYGLQRQLFSTPPSQKVPLLLVGDRLFIEQVRSLKPGLYASAYVLVIPAFNYSDFRSVFRAFKGRRVEKLIIQSSPHLWSDYWFKHKALNIDIWVNQGRQLCCTLWGAEIVFDSLRDMVKKGKSVEDDRPASLLATHPTNKPRNAPRILLDIKSLVFDYERVAWVGDLQNLPVDAPDGLVDAFREKMKLRAFKPSFGHTFMSIEDSRLQDWVDSNVR